MKISRRAAATGGLSLLAGSSLGSLARADEGFHPIERKTMADNTSYPRTQRIGIFVFGDFEPIDVFGFVEAFTIARFLGTGYGSPPPYPFEVFLIARQVGKVTSYNGPSVLPDCDFDQALNAPPDLLMIPGGRGRGLCWMTRRIQRASDCCSTGCAP
jgi:hypothetical protein